LQYPDAAPIEALLPKLEATAAAKETKTSAEALLLAARSAAAELHPTLNLAPFQVTDAADAADAAVAHVLFFKMMLVGEMLSICRCCPLRLRWHLRGRHFNPSGCPVQNFEQSATEL
jgi:hypothetical protein